jgi:hypothetical protein
MKLPILSFALFLFVKSSLPSSFFVSTATGAGDANDGSVAHPWSTWGKAVGAAKAGDTVNFRAGTYTVTVAPLTAHAGTSVSPVVVQAFGKEKVIISGDSVAGLLYLEHPYWVFDGLTFAAKRLFDHDHGIFNIGDNNDASHPAIRNCTFQLSSTLGQDNVSCIRLQANRSSYATIANNSFEGYTQAMPGGAAVQYLGGSNIGTRIVHNTINNFNLGVYIKHRNLDSGTTGAEIAFNYVFACTNAFYGNPRYLSFHDNLSVGCGFNFGDNGGYEQGKSNIINHNTVFNAGLFFDNPSEGPIANCTVTNSIFMAPVQLSPWASGSPTPHHTQLDYNLYINGASAFIEYGVDYSLDTWRTHHGGDASSITGVPLFKGGVTPATVAGYSLAAGSPGINAASDARDMGADIDSVGPLGSQSSIENKQCLYARSGNRGMTTRATLIAGPRKMTIVDAKGRQLDIRGRCITEKIVLGRIPK